MTFYYGFLPDGDLPVSDGGIQPEVRASLSRLRPAIMAAIGRCDYATAVSVALGALEGIADELRPSWADALTQDQALVQAVMVQVGCDPSHGPPLPLASADVSDGSAVWLVYRAWATSREEALSAAERLGANPELVMDGDGFLPLADEEGGPPTLWTRTWI